MFSLTSVSSFEFRPSSAPVLPSGPTVVHSPLSSQCVHPRIQMVPHEKALISEHNVSIRCILTGTVTTAPYFCPIMAMTHHDFLWSLGLPVCYYYLCLACSALSYSFSWRKPPLLWGALSALPLLVPFPWTERQLAVLTLTLCHFCLFTCLSTSERCEFMEGIYFVIHSWSQQESTKYLLCGAQTVF